MDACYDKQEYLQHSWKDAEPHPLWTLEVGICRYDYMHDCSLPGKANATREYHFKALKALGYLPLDRVGPFGLMVLLFQGSLSFILRLRPYQLLSHPTPVQPEYARGRLKRLSQYPRSSFRDLKNQGRQKGASIRRQLT